MSLQAAPRRALHWFRSDLRLADNPALLAASAAEALACVFIDETNATFRPQGGARRWWLHGALSALDESIRARGGTLTILRGDSRALIPELAQQLGCDLVTWNRRYGLAEREEDAAIKTALSEGSMTARSFNGALLYEPWEVETKTGGPFRVFTPFWRACRASHEPPAPLPAPERLPPCPGIEAALTLDSLALLPTKPDWAGGMRAAWTPGEAGAHAALAQFLDGGFAGYAEYRDRPDLTSTSRLSPYLASGELSPRQVWHRASHARLRGATRASDVDETKFFAELGWREFSYHLLFHFPDFATRNHQPRFDAFPWRDDASALRAWQKGLTGYPLVDAGMRELWQTGFIHNRVRMVVASFLAKHLMLDWRAGERWFFDTLVDADPASNAASWQWVAGSGADAAPYFRIFNPVLQGEKFDPEGDYVRAFVPELARLPAKYIHRPWEAPKAVLAGAGILLGKDYPKPVVDHDAARARALAAFESLS
ncbi:MAG: DNA photolyase family protein [Proteobacteria bacterium]|nr:DNA photolyase family protein [Pseudomonadota bacterium]